jgi:hypothetical protein
LKEYEKAVLGNVAFLSLFLAMNKTISGGWKKGEGCKKFGLLHPSIPNYIIWNFLLILCHLII